MLASPIVQRTISIVTETLFPSLFRNQKYTKGVSLYYRPTILNNGVEGPSIPSHPMANMIDPPQNNYTVTYGISFVSKVEHLNHSPPPPHRQTTFAKVKSSDLQTIIREALFMTIHRYFTRRVSDCLTLPPLLCGEGDDMTLNG